MSISQLFIVDLFHLFNSKSNGAVARLLWDVCELNDSATKWL